MRLFEKLVALLLIPKVLENLTTAIRAAAERKSNEDDREIRVRAELRLTEAAERQRRAEQEKQTAIQCWIARGTWAAFIAASVYGAISCGQWREMHKQTIEANRAWLAFIQAYSDTNIGPNLVVRLEYQNVGRAPALGIALTGPDTFFINYDISNPVVNIPEKDECKGLQPSSGGPLSYPPPTKSTTETYVLRFETPERRNGIAGVAAGNQAMVFAGCAAYTSFDKPRYTQYCFFARLMPDKKITYGICPTGNHAT